MAMAVASEDGDQPAIDISKLHLSKLRKLAKNFGIKMISKMPSAVIRIHLAKNAHIGSILDNVIKIKTAPTHDKRMQNTIVRLVNVIFSHGFIQGLMEWNNHRKRADHETGVGGTMDRFFVQVHTAMYAIDEDDGEDDGGEEKIPDVADREDDRSIYSFDADDAPDDSLELERVNLVLERTTNANDPYASLSRFEERTDLDHEKVELYFETADPDPGQYMKLPPKVLRGWTSDLLRARKKLVENMKSVQDFDKSFSPFMDARLKGDSTSSDVGKDDDFSAMTGGSDTTVTKQGESMERMANYFELIQQSTSIAAAAATSASHATRRTNEQQLRLSIMQEAQMLKRELGQSDGSPIPSDIRARMQARLNTLYEEL
ncbi:hypothetical protein IV203_008877 [Nitzschia inconspicua]|uniref:Uncharacterized protein n=1 Tax=Nitzschia inconspicua TaxID=303405 RepID=A0A9K3PPV3_9STRA|nr:hypothetical protein IV203_008877 [Nitzschia inconspicua]